MNVRLLLLLSWLYLGHLTTRSRRSCARCRIVRAACLLLSGRRLGCCLVGCALASHVECRDELKSLRRVAQHVLEVFRSDIFGQSVCVCDDLLQAIFVQRQQLLQQLDSIFLYARRREIDREMEFCRSQYVCIYHCCHETWREASKRRG